ncbi:helix-turn-helix domain-containing protein [Streptomyces sp. NRRL F-5053]|uniref:helix-turn-helix domain-containing protein n=1 Tax=Streptomyces sp. NRRL F-5053 TaxID=1463854 RepID=UPI001331757C|nr:helix-turn-helix transcriptional regulator [Streptomyces sp. NRRL F-5053]
MKGVGVSVRRHRLQERRLAVGLTQEQLAEKMGVERTTVVRWESGKRMPQISQRPRLAGVLGVTLAELHDLLASPHDADRGLRECPIRHPSRVDDTAVAALRQEHEQPRNRYGQGRESIDRLDPALPWTAARMVESLEAAVGGPMKRRSLLSASGAAVSQYVLQSVVAPTEAMATDAKNGTPVTPVLLNSLQATTDELRHLDASGGSGTLVGTARQHLKTLLALAKPGVRDERMGRRLAAVIADAAIQAGWYTFDGGQHVAGQQLFLGAIRAARASEDSRLHACALSFLAIHGYSVGDPRDAVTAARTARHRIKDQDAPALHAMLLTRQARAHARLREERHTLAALDEAEGLCARGRGEDDPHWLYWMNLGEIFGQRGSCYLDLGRPDEAERAFRAARGALNHDDARTRAQFLSRAATAQMRTGDADAGCRTGQEVLALAEGITSSRLDENLQAMLSEAHRFKDARAIRPLLDQGETVLRQRTPA